MAAPAPFLLLGWDIPGDSDTVPAGWVPLDLLFLSLLMVPVFLTGFLSFFMENTVSGEGMLQHVCMSWRSEGLIWPWDHPQTSRSASRQPCSGVLVLFWAGLVQLEEGAPTSLPPSHCPLPWLQEPWRSEGFSLTCR